MSNAELMAELLKLRAENEALKASKAKPLSVKVNAEKGTISVYGLGRFPVSLYRSQWERLFAFADSVKNCMTENKALLDAKQEQYDAA